MKNQMQTNILQNIIDKINLGWSFQPILFLWENKDLLNSEINDLILELFKYFEVDKNNFYKLEDNEEKIKILQMREFISKWNIKPSDKFQIFFIENFSRATIETANASLKFLEEPWNGNIIFLSNQSESWILETILSRVHVINIFSNKKSEKNEFFYQLIDDFHKKKNENLIKYFFADKKLEKDDYINFLNSFLFYIKENFVYTELLDQIEESLNLIQKNNVLPKYEIDKLILKL